MLMGGLGGGCSGGLGGAEKRGTSGRLLLGSSGAGMVGTAFGAASGALGRFGICIRGGGVILKVVDSQPGPCLDTSGGSLRWVSEQRSWVVGTPLSPCSRLRMHLNMRAPKCCDVFCLPPVAKGP